MRNAGLFFELAKKRSINGKSFGVYTYHADDSSSQHRVTQAKQLEEDGYIVFTICSRTTFESDLHGVFTDKGIEAIKELKIEREI